MLIAEADLALLQHPRWSALWYVCVCVCVCLYSSTVKASSVCKTYVRARINDLVLRISVDCVMLSSIIAIYENVIFHLQRRKLQPLYYWRENDMI